MSKEKKRLSRKQYLQQKKEKILKRYTCKLCGKPLELVAGTNIMMCNNAECKGIERKYYENGKEAVTHEAFYTLLDSRGSEVVNGFYNE